VERMSASSTKFDQHMPVMKSAPLLEVVTVKGTYYCTTILPMFACDVTTPDGQQSSP